MQVKKYRATSTREALEQIKKELGEDAFVLETKRVRVGGFMGMGSETQIEISAAAPASASASAAEEQRTAPKRLPAKRLNITDDAPATPKSSKNSQAGLMAAIAARANSDAFIKNANRGLTDAAENKTLNSGSQMPPVEFPAESRSNSIEAVEIAPHAPRVVHAKIKEAGAQTMPPLTLVPNKTVEPASPNSQVSNRELELLRAEMREMKFSLGAFATRQNPHSISAGADPYTLGEIFDSPFYEAYIELTVCGVSAEISRKLVADTIPLYRSGAVKAEQIAQAALCGMFPGLIKLAEDPLQGAEPAMLAIIGATGVGKTTTIAKLAARIALRERRRVELVTLDTYRIAAVEQLRTYAEIIGAGCHVVHSVLELDATLQKMPAGVGVLIDTTGRNPHDLADQYELSDYLRRRRDIRKCLTIQATTSPQDAIAAAKKFEMYGADCLALTKMDETTRPGAVVEIAAEANLPLVYLCSGQRVPEDLQLAAPESFAARILYGQNSFEAAA